MKLLAIYEECTKKVTDNISDDRLSLYVEDLKKTGNYKNLMVRVPNDVKYALFSPKTVCSWYETYDCNDNHITTLFKKIIKENYPKTWEAMQE